MAHQFVALGYMLLCSMIGGAVFLNPAAWPANAAGALLVPNGTSRFLGAVLLGELLAWDIPCGLLIKKLRKPDMLVHHVLMAFGPAYNAVFHAPIFTGVFYLGLSELSTVPLTLNEMHASAHDTVAAKEPESPRLAGLSRWRDAWQVVAAISFVIVRAFGWVCVTGLSLLPDTLQVLPTAGKLKPWLLVHLIGGISFTALQLYWFLLLVRYTISNGMGGKRPDS